MEMNSKVSSFLSGERKKFDGKKFMGSCHYCKKQGHKRVNCFKEKRDKLNNGESERSNAAWSFVANSDSGFLDGWVLDSGASRHLTGKRDLMHDIKSCEAKYVVIADGSKKRSIEKGKVLIKHGLKEILIDEVYYVPGLKANLVSVDKLVQKGHKVSFGKFGAKVERSNGDSLKIAKENGIYVMSAIKEKEQMFTLRKAHEILGHLNVERIVALIRAGDLK
jgi:hypothetical protein